MPRLKPEAKRAAITKRRAQLDAQLKALDAKEKDKARKDDARLKIIVGALAWEHTQRNPNSAYAAKTRELIADYVKPDARHLFDFLTPVAETQKPASAPPAPRIQSAAAHLTAPAKKLPAQPPSAGAAPGPKSGVTSMWA